jgi:hypothetical protein
MFPVVGYKLDDKSTESSSENNNELIVENKHVQSDNNISEEKIEL